ncbi:hypothetical protein LTR17_012611 [Elasticomyces elasticus]|nr:hypothetical protein LTR17_012611 [Elasticomyces elasticus]
MMADRLVQEYLDRAHAAEQLVLKLRVEADRRDWELDEIRVRLARLKDRFVDSDYKRLFAVDELEAAKAKIAKLEKTVRELKDQTPEESTTETGASLGSVSYTPVDMASRVAPNGNYIPPSARAVRSRAREAEVETQRLERRALEREQRWAAEPSPSVASRTSRSRYIPPSLQGPAPVAAAGLPLLEVRRWTSRPQDTTGGENVAALPAWEEGRSDEGWQG